MSQDRAGLVEIEPRTARKYPWGIAVAEIAEEIRLDPPAGEKLGVDFGVVEAGHRAGVEAQGARGYDEVGALQAAVAHRRHRRERRIGEPQLCLGFMRKEPRHLVGK